MKASKPAVSKTKILAVWSWRNFRRFVRLSIATLLLFLAIFFKILELFFGVIAVLAGTSDSREQKKKKEERRLRNWVMYGDMNDRD